MCDSADELRALVERKRQIDPAWAGDPMATEWVRYDLLVDRQHVVRTQPSAWFSVFRAITSRGGANSGQPIGPGAGSLTPGDEGQLDYGQPRGDGVGRIGYLDPIEDVGENGYPIVHVTRHALGFRGDPFTGTTSHTQRVNAMVVVPDASQRQLGKVYDTPKGQMRWMGNGWASI